MGGGGSKNRGVRTPLPTMYIEAGGKRNKNFIDFPVYGVSDCSLDLT